MSRTLTPEHRARISAALRGRAKSPEHVAKIAAAQRVHKTPEERQRAHRSAQLLTRYGITLQDYEAMLDAQGGRCAICATDTPGGRGAFHVDHDHATGAVRALLCNRCNREVGVVEMNGERLQAYLARFGGAK